MNSYLFFYTIVTIVIIISYFNHKYFKKQAAVIMMLTSTLISLCLIASQYFYIFPGKDIGIKFLRKFDLFDFLINGVLCLLLFSGAITIDPIVLETCKLEVFILSLMSTIASSIIIGASIYFILSLFHVLLPLPFCLVFGSLISPTDPVAVLSIFNKLQVPKRLVACMAGESLFNDGIGIVLFFVFSKLAAVKTEHISFLDSIILFIRQSFGGIVCGGILGFILTESILSIDSASVSILLTVAAVVGGYSTASLLKISGALSTASMAIVLSYRIKTEGLLSRSGKILNLFWEIVDELLNSTLFFLIGFELLIIDFSQRNILACLISIPVVLFSRLITVALPMHFIQLKSNQTSIFTPIMIWGGLRGALALALGLDWVKNIAPAQASMVLAMTYSVVAFSILFQGSSIEIFLEFIKQKNTKYQNQMQLDFKKDFTIRKKTVKIEKTKVKKFYFKEKE